MAKTTTWSHEDIRHNTVVHTVDAGFFGLAMGLSSFIYVVPLFLSTVTSTPVLLGLVAVLHPLGWHLPQFVAARTVGNHDRLLPLVLRLTLNERVPFVFLAVLAALARELHPAAVVLFTYVLVFWIGLGGGITAPAFLTLVARIVAPWRIGVFLGLKSSAANLGLAAGALIAGAVLAQHRTTWGFPAVFLGAAMATGVSWMFLALTREHWQARPAKARAVLTPSPSASAILRRDSNFRWYMTARTLSQFAMMGVAFLTVYATGRGDLSTAGAGAATAAFGVAQVAANPILTHLGDRAGFRRVMAAAMLCAAAASLIAAFAPSTKGFVLVFALAGVANVGAWTVPLAMTTQFGADGEAPAYIGLGNTLVAPSILLAPLVGGTLAQLGGYQWTFAAAAAAGVASTIVLTVKVQDPWKLGREPDGILD